MVRTRNINNTTLKLVLFIAVGCLCTLVLLNQQRLGLFKDQKSGSSLKLEDVEPNPESPAVTMERKVGGLGGAREKDDEVVAVVEKIKPDFEQKTAKQYKSLEVIHYKTQVVAGRNYFVKVKAIALDDSETIAHLRIYVDLQHNHELTAFEVDKKLEDELVHFQ